MNSLSEIINSLIKKEIRVTLTSGKEITGALSEGLTDALIINTKEGKVVVAVGHIAMIQEKKPKPKATVRKKPPGL